MLIPPKKFSMDSLMKMTKIVDFHFLDAVSRKVSSIMLEKFSDKFKKALLFENIGSKLR